MAFRLGEMLRGLFKPGDSVADAAVPGEAVEYKGFTILPLPRQQGSGWSTEGKISKAFPEGNRETHFIRADVNTDRNDALACCVLKAKRIIDEQGERMFDRN